MDFELSDEQRQLADSLERLLAQQYGLDQRKAIIAAGGSAAIWAKIAELGILSLPVSETGGGFGGGAVDLLRPMALLGHALVIEPVIPHLTAARLLDRAAAALPAAAASSWHERLRQSVHGNLRLAWARSTGAAAPACSAQADGDGWRLDGRIDGVVGADPDGGTGPAAALFVSAPGPAGTRLLFLLPEPLDRGLRTLREPRSLAREDRGLPSPPDGLVRERRPKPARRAVADVSDRVDGLLRGAGRDEQAGLRAPARRIVGSAVV